MAKYLTLSGLQTFYNGLKTKLNNKVDKAEGYSLTKNDLTDELKAQYDAAYQYATTTDAEKNVIVGVKVNGADLVVDEDRKVDVTVPTKTSDITNDSDFTTNEALNSAKEELEGKITTVDGKFADYYNKGEVDTTVSGLQEAIAAAAAGKITIKVVTSIDKEAKTYTDTEGTKAAEANVIYLVPKDPTQPNNVKDEWMLIDNAFEKIGDTEIDLSDYAVKTQVATDISTAKGEVVGTDGDLKEAATVYGAKAFATDAASTAQAAAISAAAEDATTKADAAETAAIEAAAADATSKADTAKADAIAKAEELNTAMDTRVKAVESVTTAIEAITTEEIEEILAS